MCSCLLQTAFNLVTKRFLQLNWKKLLRVYNLLFRFAALCGSLNWYLFSECRETVSLYLAVIFNSINSIDPQRIRKWCVPLERQLYKRSCSLVPLMEFPVSIAKYNNWSGHNFPWTRPKLLYLLKRRQLRSLVPKKLILQISLGFLKVNSLLVYLR